MSPIHHMAILVAAMLCAYKLWMLRYAWHRRTSFVIQSRRRPSQSTDLHWRMNCQTQPETTNTRRTWFPDTPVEPAFSSITFYLCSAVFLLTIPIYRRLFFIFLIWIFGFLFCNCSTVPIGAGPMGHGRARAPPHFDKFLGTGGTVSKRMTSDQRFWKLLLASCITIILYYNDLLSNFMPNNGTGLSCCRLLNTVGL